MGLRDDKAWRGEVEPRCRRRLCRGDNRNEEVWMDWRKRAGAPGCDRAGEIGDDCLWLAASRRVVQVQAQPSTIDPEQWALLVGIARTMKEIAPDASLEDVEAALRASFAKAVGAGEL